jgi:hypothetical protein
LVHHRHPAVKGRREAPRGFEYGHGVARGDQVGVLIDAGGRQLVAAVGDVEDALDLCSHAMPGKRADAAERVDEAIQRALKAAGKSVE